MEDHEWNQDDAELAGVPVEDDAPDGSPEAIVAVARSVCNLSDATAELIADDMVIDDAKLLMDRSLDGKWQHVRFSFAVQVQP